MSIRATPEPTPAHKLKAASSLDEGGDVITPLVEACHQGKLTVPAASTPCKTSSTTTSDTWWDPSTEHFLLAA